MTTYTQSYTLHTGSNQVNITLINPGSYIILEGSSNKVTTFQYGTIGTQVPSQQFTVYSADQYVYAMVETQYTPPSASINPPSYCHIYFKPGGTNWIWSTDAQTADNFTIFKSGQGERLTQDIHIQTPTAPNPSGIVSTYPCLNSDLVFLLDINANGNMLFRGNVPLTPGTTGQTVDFNQLHRMLQTKYLLQTGKTDFPAIGSYVLRDIAFLNSDPDDEGGILLAEIGAFGATATSQVDQTWYPATPAAISPSGILAQVANWNVQPTGGSPAHPNLNLDVEMCQKLSKWMNNAGPDASLPTIYYIHCSSGHDRTGMISTGYLLANYNTLSLSDAFIMGTTIHKLSIPMGGNLIQNCYSIENSSISESRSRCFVAGNGSSSNYNDTIVDIYNTLNSVDTGALSAQAISGDPAIGNTGDTFVHSYYPWDMP